MPAKPLEDRFESFIEKQLLSIGYQRSFTHSRENESHYDKKHCVVPSDLLGFIKETQKEEYDNLYEQFNELTDERLLKVIDESITKRGIIDVLRKGIDSRGCHFDLCYFKPKSGLNPEHLKLYGQNRFTVVRQLHYSQQNRNSIDLVIFLNGIPIITTELKNQLSGQSIIDGQKQYKYDRDPREKLLSFQRCLVHFCVDNDKACMTTQLKGAKTKFFPYNKGIENPIVEDGYRTEYIWKEILTPDSLLDIIENFVLISEESKSSWNAQTNSVKTEKFNVQIFPRYHQLEVIRKLRNTVRQEGTGKNYLIQHTTGSGKSYSIGWLAHSLTSLYQNTEDTNRLFDTILVITDRKVLDKQLQATVGKLERTKGVVNPVDLNSEQLKGFLEKGKDIIITTIQKFPFVSQTISELKSKTFAVIVDEVHSSQSGESAKHLKSAITEHEDEELDLEDKIRMEIESRGRQDHVSFFGFTGTPKQKTLELFGRKDSDGKFKAFHYYTMQQSIAEQFTLDVLSNYTTYSRYFKVIQKGEEDKEVSENEAKKKLVNYVDSHKATISQKVTIILDHFVPKASKKINGKARAMVVVRSRKHCVLFHEEMVRQMRERGLSYSCLVAFSGSIYHNGADNTESSLNSSNGLEGSSIPNGLKDPRFRILIVSSKFQTGFDEPMLQSMYVDKKLGGVQCVQTLSRLNRTMSGKNETFVLDFANKIEDIQASFADYYTTTHLSGETEPDALYDLLHEIEQYNVYTEYELRGFCTEFYSHREDDSGLQPWLNEPVRNYEDNFNDEEKDDFKSKIQSFCRLYSYIAQIASFKEERWEMSYVFLRYLNKKLPKGMKTTLDLSDSIDLGSLRIQMIGESNISLPKNGGELDPITGGSGGGQPEEELTPLSEIIKQINEFHGSNLKEEDRVTLEQVTDELKKDQHLIDVMNARNSKEDIKSEIDKLMMDAFYRNANRRYDFINSLEKPEIRSSILEYMTSQLMGKRA